MKKMAPYAKFVQYVLLAVGGGFLAALSDGRLAGTEFVTIAILAGTAATVYAKANTSLQPHAKAAVAVFGAGVAAVHSAWSDQTFSTTELVMILMAVIGAVQVGTVANVPPGPQPEANKDDTAGSAGVDPTTLYAGDAYGKPTAPPKNLTEGAL